MTRYLLSLLTSVLLAGTAWAAEPAAPPDAAQLKRMSARFAPVDLKVDLSKLPDNERRALAKMVQAAQLMDTLFLRQAWAEYQDGADHDALAGHPIERSVQ